MTKTRWVAAAVLVCVVLAVGALAHAADTEDWAAGVAKSAASAVVTIELFDEDDEATGQGSGFIVTSDGLVVTNYHVVQGAAYGLVKLRNGSFFPIVGAVRKSLPLTQQDLVLLKCEARELPSLRFGSLDEGSVGRRVMAIGSPMGLEATVSTGVVSAVRELRPGVRVAQSTASISPGSSGGPLLDSAGLVVGVNSAFLSEGQNLNFAVSVEALRALVTGLEDSDKTDTVSLSEVETARAGGPSEPQEPQWPEVWSAPTSGMDVFRRTMALNASAVYALDRNLMGLRLLASVDVLVEDLDDDARGVGLTAAYLKSYVELAIDHSSFLNVSEDVEPYVYVRLTVLPLGGGAVAYTAELRVERPALLTLPSGLGADGRAVKLWATAWSKSLIGTCSEGSVRRVATDLIDSWLVELLNDVRKANPPDEAE